MSPAVSLAWALRRFGFERVDREAWVMGGGRRHFYRRGGWTVSIIAGHGPYHVAWSGARGRRDWYVITSRTVPKAVVLRLVGEVV